MGNLAALILPNRPIGYANLKAEQKICVEFANEMRFMTLEKKLPYIWFHVSNEFLPSTRVNYSFELKLKHMGKIPGVPDYCFVSSRDGFFIEFKTPHNTQGPNQKLFQEWCSLKDVGYFLCHSAEEGISVVKDHLEKLSM
jgi:hypothetical protein